MEGQCRYLIGTESPIRRRLILLDRSDLILAESFDPSWTVTSLRSCIYAIYCVKKLW